MVSRERKRTPVGGNHATRSPPCSINTISLGKTVTRLHSLRLANDTFLDNDTHHESRFFQRLTKNRNRFLSRLIGQVFLRYTIYEWNVIVIHRRIFLSPLSFLFKRRSLTLRFIFVPLRIALYISRCKLYSTDLLNVSPSVKVANIAEW